MAWSDIINTIANLRIMENHSATAETAGYMLDKKPRDKVEGYNMARWIKASEGIRTVDRLRSTIKDVEKKKPGHNVIPMAVRTGE